MSNSTLLRTTGRSARHSRGGGSGGGMTSSSSASSNSNNNLDRFRECRETREQKDKDDGKDSHRPTRLLLQNGEHSILIFINFFIYVAKKRHINLIAFFEPMLYLHCAK